MRVDRVDGVPFAFAPTTASAAKRVQFAMTSTDLSAVNAEPAAAARIQISRET